MIGTLERAVAADPTFAQGFIDLGYAWLNLGEWGPAEAALRRAIDIDRESPTRSLTPRALYLLGWVQTRTGRLDEARATLTEAVTISRDHVLTRAAEAFLDADRRAAVDKLSVLVDEAPYRSEVVGYYAQALIAQSWHAQRDPTTGSAFIDPASARAVVARLDVASRSLMPDLFVRQLAFTCLYQSATLKRALLDHQGAMYDALEAETLAQEDLAESERVRLYELLATLLFESGLDDDALQRLTWLERLSPRGTTAPLLRGAHLLAKGERREALRDIVTAATRIRENDEAGTEIELRALALLITATVAEGQWREAEGALDRLLSLPIADRIGGPGAQPQPLAFGFARAFRQRLGALRTRLAAANDRRARALSELLTADANRLVGGAFAELRAKRFEQAADLADAGLAALDAAGEEPPVAARLVLLRLRGVSRYQLDLDAEALADLREVVRLDAALPSDQRDKGADRLNLASAIIKAAGASLDAATRDEALTLLEEAVARGLDPAKAKRAPVLAPALRGDARFERLGR